MKTVIFIILSYVELSFQIETKPIAEVCQQIKECEEDVFQEMKKPGPLSEKVMHEKLKKYIAVVDELIKYLHSDKEGTYKVAKDIIDKKGPKFSHEIPWTWKMARLEWGWDGRVIQDFLNTRMEVNEAWMDVMKYFDPKAFIPKEMYTESYEESNGKVS